MSTVLVLLLTLLTRIRFSEYRHSSSIVFLRLRAAFSNLALPLFFFLVTTDAVGRGSFSVLCLNSLAVHRDLRQLCGARRLLLGARSSSRTLL